MLFKNEEVVYNKIKSDLRENKILVIDGPSGSGKSYVLNKINVLWGNMFPNNESLLCSSNLESNISAPYQILYNSIAKLAHNNIKEFTKRLLITGAKDIPFLSNTLSFAIESLSNIENKKTISNIDVHTDNLLSIIDKLYKGKDLLIICDDFNNWDKYSQKFILNVNNFLDKTKIKSIRIIIESKANIFNELFINRSLAKRIEIINIKSLSKNDVINALTTFNSTINLIDNNLIEAIYSITGGDLNLLKFISSVINSDYDEILRRYDDVYCLIKSRLDKNTSDSDEVMLLLKQASIIGEILIRYELEKITDYAASTVSYYIKSAKEFNLLYEDINSIRFANRAIYKAIRNNIRDKDIRYYIKYANCLREIKPSQYFLRSHYYLLGGNDIFSMNLFFLGLLSDTRELKKKASINDYPNIDFTEQLEDLYNNLCECYELYFDGNFLLSMKMCKKNIITNNVNIDFEIDYILALNAVNLDNLSIQNQMLVKLENWLNHDEIFIETEQWTRAASLAIDLFLNLSQYSDCIELSRKLISRLTKISSTDVFLRDRLYKIKSKSTVYKNIESAYLDSKQALDFFNPRNNENLNLRNYYLSLVNHSANAIVLGKYSEARDLCIEALNLYKENTSVKMIRVDTLINNYLLSSLLSNSIDTNVGERMFNILLSKLNDSPDRLLIRSNSSVYCFLSGNIIQAFNLISECYIDLIESNVEDPYYVYFITNNYAVISLKLGKIQLAKSLWNKIKQLLPLPNNKEYFNLRNKYMAELFENKGIYIEHLSELYGEHIGTPWKFWAKTLLLSELQIWSDT